MCVYIFIDIDLTDIHTCMVSSAQLYSLDWMSADAFHITCSLLWGCCQQSVLSSGSLTWLCFDFFRSTSQGSPVWFHIFGKIDPSFPLPVDKLR